MKTALHRVKAIPALHVSRDECRFAGDLALEYLRRAALMAQSLPSWNSGPFFDPAVVTSAALDSKIDADIDAAVSEDVQPNGYVRRLCSDYIRWQAYVEMGNPVACSHPDVYEPLMRLFEQRQSLGFHHGELIVGGFAIPLLGWLRFAERPALNLQDLE